MSIKFLPDQMLKKIAPESKIKKLVSKGVTLKRAALSFLDGADFIDKSQVVDTALKTIKGYKERIKGAGDEDDRRAEKAEILDDPKQLIQRVKNQIVWQVHQGIQDQYRGQRARWLPSGADEPRPLHQKAYGQEYIIGEGLPVGENGENVEPGDEWGCDCGVEILTDETQLKLE